jgi:hypothetical protein
MAEVKVCEGGLYDSILFDVGNLGIVAGEKLVEKGFA